jgi:hypothetical protein
MSASRSIYDANPRKSSLVDYSKVSSRPDVRNPASVKATAPEQSASVAVAMSQQPPPPPPPVVSAQMDAVMRLMTGREERTIAEKLADTNRPTWEQYKKDNHDKLNLDTLDQTQMDEYRRQLDEERDKRMAGLSTHDKHKKDKKKKKSHKKKHRRKHDDENSTCESISSSRSESSSYEDNRRRRKHRKHHKHRDTTISRKKEHEADDENHDELERETKKKHERKPSKYEN